MKYTCYLLEEDSPAVLIISEFEQIRKGQIIARQKELDKYGAIGCISSGSDGSPIALQFENGEESKGWKIPNDLRKYSEVDEDGVVSHFYRLMGSSKAAKEQRSLWSTLAVSNFRHFTNMFKDLPKGVSGWGFQDGLTIRQMGYERLKDEFVLIVPFHKIPYIPEKARELLNSEYLEMGGTAR